MNKMRVEFSDNGVFAIASKFENGKVTGSLLVQNPTQKSKTIQEKIAVLKLCPERQEVRGIGKKFSDSVFYLHCTDQEMQEVFN